MAKKTTKPRVRLTLAELSDRDLLHAYERASGGGSTTAAEVADELGAGGGDRSIAVRFGWLRSWGIMDKDSEGLWVPTPIGEQLLSGELRKAQQRALGDMKEIEVYAATMALTNRFAHVNNDAVAHMVQREMRHGMMSRRLNGRG